MEAWLPRLKQQGLTTLSDQKLVFVVDDDLGTLRGLQRLLSKHGYECMLFQSAEAFEQCDAFERGLCVVLDVELNGESGIAVRYRLSAAGISLPVVYITANDNDSVRLAAMESGCIAYLEKPFPAKSLIELIEQVAAATPASRS
jgi:FixJ family two-component response regulator